MQVLGDLLGDSLVVAVVGIRGLGDLVGLLAGRVDVEEADRAGVGALDLTVVARGLAHRTSAIIDAIKRHALNLSGNTIILILSGDSCAHRISKHC